MDENLTEGGETAGRSARTPAGPTSRAGPYAVIPQIKRWLRTPKAIIMHLTNGTIQVRLISYCGALMRKVYILASTLYCF
jgi:hypothetical protein